MNTTSDNNNAQATALTKFNQVISIEVSLDYIAETLASKMNPEFPHSNLVTNVIIGQAVANGNMTDLGRIFSALNGHVDKLDFEVGQNLFCTETTHDYLFSTSGKRREIGPCVISKVDPLRNRSKIQVSYKTMNHSGTVKEDINWVDPSDLRALSESEPEQAARAIELALEDRKPKAAASL